MSHRSKYSPTHHQVVLKLPAPSYIRFSVILLALLGLLLNGNALAAREGNNTEASLYLEYCSNTSIAAKTACRFESKEDYVSAWAACYNILDVDERKGCYVDIKNERSEAQEECADQLAAREEVCDLIGQSRYEPQYDPDDFVDPESIGFGDGDIPPNPYFPLVAGMKWVYEAEDEIIIVEVLEDTIEVDGVECVVIRDVVYETESEEDEDETRSAVENDDDLPGVPVEDTLDWFAQDEDGNVWYFGEISLNYEDGVITDIEGSWKTGEEGAKAGILMPAAPMVGEVYRQEWLLGDAEDVAEVLSTTAEPELGEDNVGDCSSGCLQTLEWTPLEGDSYEYKYYQAGVGMVQEADPEDPESTVELVEFSGGME